MTTIIRPVSAGTSRRDGRAAVAVPAEVWDLPAAHAATRTAGSVRPLGVQDRTRGQQRGRLEIEARRDPRSFEPRHENRDNLLLGGLLAGALLLGSLCGGAFSANEPVPYTEYGAVVVQAR